MTTTMRVSRNAEAGADLPWQSASLLTPRPRPTSEPLRSEPSARLGEQVRHLRVAAGISAGQLSKHAAVSRSMLSRIENGLVSLSVNALRFDATALHGADALVKHPASHLSVMFILRD